MRHQDLTINHRLESWSFVDATARNLPGSYAPSDVGRIGYQQNTFDYWRLLTTVPTWKRVNGVYASLQTAQVAGPITTTSTAGVMMGLGQGASAAVITPTVSGKIVVTIGGTISNAVAGKQSTLQGRYGPTPAPALNAPLTGTLFGPAAALVNNLNNGSAPFSVTGVITNAALGVPIWFDVGLITTTGGIAGILWISVSATEMP